MNNGLEALTYLKENKRKHWLDGDKTDESLSVIEKELRALEIIKDKGVDATEIMIQNTLCAYNRFASCYPNNNYHRKALTQEEYDLLKEVLL